MLDFIERVNRSREADIHSKELLITLNRVYDDAFNYLERVLPTQKQKDTVRIDWIGPVFAMSKRISVHLGEFNNMAVRLGKEQGWTYRLSRPKPDVMIECFYVTTKLPTVARTEQYILSYDGTLQLKNPNVQQIDWPDIPSEEIAQRVNLVRHAVNAMTGTPLPTAPRQRGYGVSKG